MTSIIHQAAATGIEKHIRTTRNKKTRKAGFVVFTEELLAHEFLPDLGEYRVTAISPDFVLSMIPFLSSLRKVNFVAIDPGNKLGARWIECEALIDLAREQS